ncbi:MAG: PAS domain S-box protein [Nitrospinota bacterium]|nr:PAS domain S-box protein [Nitrospinota bacterium]
MKNLRLIKKTAFVAFLALMAIAGVGVWGLSKVESETKSNLKNHLTESLRSSVHLVRVWARERKLDLETNANNPQVRETILSLLAKTSGRELTPRELLALPEQKWLRTNLGRITKKYEFAGFILFDATGRQIAALLDEPVGRKDLIDRSDFIARALNGQTVLSTPFISETPLPDIAGNIHKIWPTMFAACPIRDAKGQVVAVLSFRMRPEEGFSEILKVRPGNSGETYAFDRQGHLLTQSRFDSQLKALGLIHDTPDGISILSVEVRDPGGDMTRGFVPEIPRNQQPLTRMARSAVVGESSWNVEGYNDYRGVPVVGAWTWLEELDFGITLEIDAAEALAPLDTLRLTFLIIFGFLLAATMLGLFQFYRKQVAEEAQAQEQKQTRQVARRMQSIFNNTVDALIIIDEFGTIESFNPAAERVFGYASQEIIGKNVNHLMPEPYHSEHDGYLRNYIQTGAKKILGTVREVTGLHKDGSTFDIELAVSEFILDTGKKFIGSVRDITERKEFEDEIHNARQEAEKASKAKSQFLSQMSHELRTPLNAILGFAQLMDDKSAMDPATHKECVNYILKGGYHLLELINDVLDLSRIETGKLSVSLEAVGLSSLVQEVLSLCETLTVANNITLIDQITDETNYVVMADRVRLRQVLFNLVANAIKYNNPYGEVTLSCKTVEDDRLRIFVADTGPGIAKEDFKLLFHPFKRLNKELRYVEGTGIGLAICKELMGLMKGEIQVESEVGKGSTFSIDLPVSSLKALPSPKKEKNNARESINTTLETQTKVLNIEDNPANLKLISQIMKTHWPDVELLVAQEGLKGLALARECRPALILLDIHLPQMTGWQVFEKLQQDPFTRNIPVVAVSANAMESDIQKTLDMGFVHYLTKPIVLDEFSKIMNRYLNSGASLKISPAKKTDSR